MLAAVSSGVTFNQSLVCKITGLREDAQQFGDVTSVQHRNGCSKQRCCGKICKHFLPTFEAQLSILIAVSQHDQYTRAVRR